MKYILKQNILLSSQVILRKIIKKIKKQGKDIDKLKWIITKLANGDELDLKYHNYRLIDNKKYKDCFECHILPDWLLVYKIFNNELILLLVDTGSHADLF